MSHSCTIFEAYLINSSRFVSVKRCWLYQNSNKTPRLSGHFFIFGFVFFLRKCLLEKARQCSCQNVAILSLNRPRSHFRTLIYRAYVGELFALSRFLQASSEAYIVNTEYLEGRRGLCRHRVWCYIEVFDIFCPIGDAPRVVSRDWWERFAYQDTPVWLQESIWSNWP